MMSTCDLGVRDWLAGKKPRSVKSEKMSLHDFPERGFLTSGGPSTSDDTRMKKSVCVAVQIHVYLQLFYSVRFSRPGNSNDTPDAKVGVCSHEIRMKGAKRLNTV